MAKDSPSLYVIGIGGTGAKCLEAIVQMAGVGLFTEEPIKLLFVDADETNGNLERARASLKIYHQGYEWLRGNNEQSEILWLKTQIVSYAPDLWSPLGNTSINKDLGSFFSYDSLAQNDEALRNLFDVLYSESERTATLNVGFRGRPSIGAAIMSRLDLNDLDSEPWASLIGEVKGDTGGGRKPRILLCGSIFGGTGASGLPTLGRLLHNKLEKENIRRSVQIACLFVLPYFQFQPKGKEAKNEVYASSDQFLLNTEAALRYYRQQNRDFDAVYLFGNQNQTEYRFSIGKNTQRNEPHFIELYAALAARHFLLKPPKRDKKVVLSSRGTGDRLSWSDLPEWKEVQDNLVNGVRFAYVWLSNILPELTTAKQLGAKTFRKGAPWIDEFFRPSHGVLGRLLDKKGQELPDFNDKYEQEAIQFVTIWCEDYLRWVIDMHECESDKVELFKTAVFKSFDGQTGGEYLRDLVLQDEREQGLRQQDSIQWIKERLSPQYVDLSPPNTGTVGLVKALYVLCQKKWEGTG